MGGFDNLWMVWRGGGGEGGVSVDCCMNWR